MRLALFDFDGTLTKSDSFMAFLRHSSTKSGFYINAIKFLPHLLLWKSGFIDNSEAKRRLVGLFFYGISRSEFEKIALSFSAHIDSLIDPSRLKLLLDHKERGDRVVIVSASIECYLLPWCKQNGIELLCTKLAFSEGIFKGEFATPNCYGEQKASRIKSYLNLAKYNEIYAYGDSAGDDQMLALSNHPTKF